MRWWPGKTEQQARRILAGEIEMDVAETVPDQHGGDTMGCGARPAGHLHAGVTILVTIACAASLPAASTPTIDGFVNDAFWTEQARTWEIRASDQPNAQSARFFLGYDDAFLYFAAEVSDRNVVGSQRMPRMRIWEDDAVKLLLHFGNPAATAWTAETFAYTFGAAGGATWSHGPQPPPADKDTEPGWPPSWTSAVNYAVALRPGSTLNTSGNRDTGFGVEARIPWTELGLAPPIDPHRTIAVAFMNINQPEASMGKGGLVTLPQSITTLHPTNPSQWLQLSLNWRGAMVFCGVVEPLPLWLGAAVPEWERYKTVQADPVGPWLNREAWTAKLRRMQEVGFDSLMLVHPAPWAGLVPLEKPNPAVTADDLARNREQFGWLIKEAADHGVRVYLQVKGTQETGAASILAAGRQPSPQTRAAAVATLRSFPGLAGLATAPDGTANNEIPALVEAIAEIRGIGPAASQPSASAPAASGPAPSIAATAMADASTPHPRLLLGTWGVYPEEMWQIVDRLADTVLLSPLQGQQWFVPWADPRIARYGLRVQELDSAPPCEPVAQVAVGGPVGALQYLLWDDPQWMRDLVLNLRSRGINGLLLEPAGMGELSFAALGQYARSTGDAFDAAAWANRLDAQYGTGAESAKLLQALQHASAVVPAFIRAVHDQSQRYMPQFGLLMLHCLEMPSASTYVFNEKQVLNPQGYLTPAIGPTWPNPDWGRPIASIRQEAANKAPAGSLRPLEIATQIAQHVEAGSRLLAELRQVQPADPAKAAALASLLDRAEMTLRVGEFLQAKMQAAVAWDRYKARRGRLGDCTAALEKSVEIWRALVPLAERVCPQPVLYWQLAPASPPPWSAGAIHSGYQPVVGHWRDQLPILEAELKFISDGGLEKGPDLALPFWPQLRPAPPTRDLNRTPLRSPRPSAACSWPTPEEFDFSRDHPIIASRVIRPKMVPVRRNLDAAQNPAFCPDRVDCRHSFELGGCPARQRVQRPHGPAARHGPAHLGHRNPRRESHRQYERHKHVGHRRCRRQVDGQASGHAGRRTSHHLGQRKERAGTE